jgi:hypothetical protein
MLVSMYLKNTRTWFCLRWGLCLQFLFIL